MLTILLASDPPRRRHVPSLALSSVTHALVLGLLITAGHATRAVVHEIREDTTLLFLPRLAPVATERLGPRVRGGGDGGGVGVVLTIAENPPARGFQTVIAVGDVPTEIPPVGANDRFIDPRDFTGRGVEGGTGWGVVGGTGPADQVPLDASLREELYDASSDRLDFLPAEMVTPPVFKYPAVLAGMGVRGRVVLQFVVDTTGLVEPGSVQVVSGTHQAFVEAAREGIGGARFYPARVGPRPVRQLTRMPIKFTMAETSAG